MYSDDVLKVAVKGVPETEYHAFMRQVSVLALQRLGGMPIPTGAVPELNFPQTEGGRAWFNLDGNEKEEWLGTLFDYPMPMPLSVLQVRGNDFTLYFDAMTDELDRAPQPTSKVIIVRDFLYKRHRLPDRYRDMTDDEKLIADAIEGYLQQDYELRREGKQMDIWWFEITDIPDAKKANNKKLAKAKQKVLNAITSGSITINDIRPDGTVDERQSNHANPES